MNELQITKYAWTKYKRGDEFQVTTIGEDTIHIGYGNKKGDGTFEYPLPIPAILKEYGALTWKEANELQNIKIALALKELHEQEKRDNTTLPKQ